MGELTTDDIKNAISAGEIGAITLDTSIFDGSGLRLEGGLLQRMAQFRGSAIKFVLSEIVAKEVTEHLAKAAQEAQSQFESVSRSLGKGWLVPQEKMDEIAANLFRGQSASDHAQVRFRDYVDSMGCEVIQVAEHVDVQELLRRYFAPESPFSHKESKKNEFPDAFALLSLEKWGKNLEKKILVVSKDGDWIRYCKNSDTLVHVEDLGTALSLFHTDASVACNLLSARLQQNDFPALEGMLEESVYRHIERMDFIVDAESSYYLDDEITDYDIRKIEVGGLDHSSPVFEPVDSGDDYLVAKLPISVELLVACDFLFSVKDGVDKDYVKIGSASSREYPAVQLEALVTFSGANPESQSIDVIEITGPSHLRVEFGYVEPEWNEDPTHEFY